MKKPSTLKILTALTHYYFIIFFLWLILSPLYGDRWRWLFLLNSFSVYFFFLLPIPFALAIITRKRSLFIGVFGVFLAGLFLYGALFLPSSTQAKENTSQLIVMTFNILGFNTQSDGVIESVRDSDADIIAFQELNPEIAEAIEQDLLEEYPYQILNPLAGTNGIGMISRIPLKETPIKLRGYWVGEPQIVEASWENKEILLINFHAIPPGSVLHAKSLRFTTQERNRQAAELVKYANESKKPVIVMGDLNVTAQNDAHRILAASLNDVWIEKGWGLGHTFPGAASSGSSRPSVNGIALVPKWLVRLDYIFCSNEWIINSASLGQWDGVSDHRPVKAVLSLHD